MKTDLISAICEEFAEALYGVVDENYLSPQECWDPLLKVLGEEIDSKNLKAITESELQALVNEMNSWFESNRITLEHITRAIKGTLVRCP